MFKKIAAVALISLGMATAGLAQQSGTNGNGSTSGNGTAATGTTNSSGGTKSMQNGSVGGVDTGTTGSTTNGNNAGPNAHGKSQDCNAMATGKKMAGTTTEQTNNPLPSSHASDSAGPHTILPGQERCG